MPALHFVAVTIRLRLLCSCVPYVQAYALTSCADNPEAPVAPIQLDIAPLVMVSNALNANPAVAYIAVYRRYTWDPAGFMLAEHLQAAPAVMLTQAHHASLQLLRFRCINATHAIQWY